MYKNEFKYPIRKSVWTVKSRSPKGRKEVVYVFEDFIVAGEHKHIPVLAGSRYYLGKIYRLVYKKGVKFEDAWNEKRITILKIELDACILGMGIGNFDQEVLDKYELE